MLTEDITSPQNSNLFSIWIDADSCPVSVRQIIIRFALRLKLQLFFVANHPIPFEQNDSFKMIVTENTPDAADNYIVENIQANDIAITRDIPLASRLVEKKITILNDRGTIYTSENIRERLSLRNFNLELFNNGIMPERTGTFGKKELNLFSNSLDKEIQKKISLLKTSKK